MQAGGRVNKREYGWKDGCPTGAHEYLLPKVRALLPLPPARIVDLGSGNGYLAGQLAAMGFEVVGVEPSPDGVANARTMNPSVRFIQASMEDDLASMVGEGFDVVLASEVIEHLYLPRQLLRTAHRLLRPGGIALVTTPYHGYWKNLALAVAGAWDRHLTVAWDGGHIKFFSTHTLGAMIEESGLRLRRFEFAGRLPWLWKSMIAVAEKPS
jgi:2-polyprenyl-3-methyl-5-hydroxy-6-metoxy-1,4-benzoquinol methylase